MAAGLYHRAAGLREGDFDTHYQAALLDLQVDNLDQAEEHLSKAIAVRPDFGPAHLNLGVVFVRRGRTAEGRRAFLEALRSDPRLTRAYYNLLVDYRRTLKTGLAGVPMPSCKGGLEPDQEWDLVYWALLLSKGARHAV